MLGEKKLNAAKVVHRSLLSLELFGLRGFCDQCQSFSCNGSRMFSCPLMTVFIKAVLYALSVYDINFGNKDFLVLTKR